MKSFARFAPLALFVLLAAFFGYQLFHKEEMLRSALLDTPAPEFELPGLMDGEPGLGSADLKTGEVSVVNFWASWCIPCKAEHPELIRLAETTDVRLYSINYKDQTDKARAFIGELGNPFEKIGVDASGREALRWGLTGVPETFVIDGNGVIVAKFGPILENTLEERVLPAIEAAKAR